MRDLLGGYFDSIDSCDIDVDKLVVSTKQSLCLVEDDESELIARASALRCVGLAEADRLHCHGTHGRADQQIEEVDRGLYGEVR